LGIRSKQGSIVKKIIRRYVVDDDDSKKDPAVTVDILGLLDYMLPKARIECKSNVSLTQLLNDL